MIERHEIWTTFIHQYCRSIAKDSDVHYFKKGGTNASSPLLVDSYTEGSSAVLPVRSSYRLCRQSKVVMKVVDEVIASSRKTIICNTTKLLIVVACYSRIRILMSRMYCGYGRIQFYCCCCSCCFCLPFPVLFIVLCTHVRSKLAILLSLSR